MDLCVFPLAPVVRGLDAQAAWKLAAMSHPSVPEQSVRLAGVAGEKSAWKGGEAVRIQLCLKGQPGGAQLDGGGKRGVRGDFKVFGLNSRKDWGPSIHKG